MQGCGKVQLSEKEVRIELGNAPSENGNEEYSVAFVTQAYFDGEIDDFKEVYLMMLPQYTDKDKQIEITEDIKKQGYCYKDDYYFRVTKEQYEELTNEFFEASNTADEGEDIRKYF